MKSLPVWPPTPGHYTMSLTRGGVQVPVKIWFGAAVIDDEEQDRGQDWRVAIDGRTDYIEKDPDQPEYRCRVLLPVDRAWPWCAKRPITEAVYRYMIDHGYWAKHHAPNHPEANPRKAIDKRGSSVF